MQKVNFKIEVDPGVATLVFDRRTDVFLTPWQDAWHLAYAMRQAAMDWGHEFTPATPFRTLMEAERMVIQHHKDHVVLWTEWVDRLRFTSLAAWMKVAGWLSCKAQDAELEWKQGTRFVYDRDGMILKALNRNGPTRVVRR